MLHSIGRWIYYIPILVVVIFLIVTQSGCKGEPAPPRNFGPHALLLPLDKLPANWEYSYGSPRLIGDDRIYGDGDDWTATYKLVSDKYNIARHHVLGRESIKVARDSYHDLIPIMFNDNSIAIDMPWQTPATFTFKSQFSDEFRMACTINNFAGRTQVCQVMAQYEEFVIIFHSVIIPGTMTLEEFEEAVRAIDEIMISHLQLDEGTVN